MILAKSVVKGKAFYDSRFQPEFMLKHNSGHADHPEWILLCDDCEDGWHASCLRPSLMVIPEGDW
jgi:hypothetical protein